MKDLLFAARALLADLASTIFFALLYALTGNIALAVALGITLAFVQIGWELIKGKTVDIFQWISLLLVIVAGGTTLITRNPAILMLQPSAIYLIIGAAMLRKGWMIRYMPPDAMTFVPDLAIGFGYVWAGLMFASAVVNFVLAAQVAGHGVVTWAALLSAWGIASKTALFLIQYAVMRHVGRRRYRAQAQMPLAAAA